MNDAIHRKIQGAVQDAVQAADKDQTDPRILVTGATGTGKSSLINAIFGKKLQEVNTIQSTTRTFTTHKYEVEPGTHILITDSPGYGEVGFDAQYSQDVVAEARLVHAVTLVLKADEKGYDRDLKIIGQAAHDPQFTLAKPLLVALNQVDKIKPLYERLDSSWDLEQPVLPDDTAKVRNIKEKMALVRQQFASVVGNRQLLLVPTMSDPDEGPVFGLDRFKLHIFRVMPDAVRFRFARVAKLAEKASQEVLDALDQEAKKVILASAAAAGAAVAINFVPVSDFLVLIPIQIGMIVKLGAIYGKTVDKESAMEVVTALGAGFAARTIFQGVISLLPVAKNFLGPPAAAAFTHGMGVAALAYFKHQTVPSPAQLQAVIHQQIQKH